MKYFTAILLVIFSSSVIALRCSNQLIQVGDSEKKILGACGQPKSIIKGKSYTFIEVISPTGRIKKIRKTIKTSILTYNFGPTNFIYRLTFQKGKLLEIQTNGYG